MTLDCLRRTPATPEWERALGHDPEGVAGRWQRIRCPLCHWHPRLDSRWTCLCGWVWNTFDTHGKCPHCAQQWTRTQCLSCGRWSLHDDWYEVG